jgi:hypothetical protein
MTLVTLLPQILLALGVGFLIANVRVALQLIRWTRRRASALVVWPAPKPPYYGLSLGIGVMLGALLLVKAYLAIPQADTLSGRFTVFLRSAFGELMMFVYFGYMLPLSTRIARGLYADGIWTDSTFMGFDQIGGIAWRAGEPPTLVILARLRGFARRLQVPTAQLGEVRRVLRDKIQSHAIEMDDGPGLHLGARDARDSV